ncbi:hypothetical protein WAI453_003885 [Rhynchosporium graminicola]
MWLCRRAKLDRKQASSELPFSSLNFQTPPNAKCRKCPDSHDTNKRYCQIKSSMNLANHYHIRYYPKNFALAFHNTKCIT